MEKRYLNTFRTLSVIFGITFLIFAGLMLNEEIISPEWKSYQDKYKKILDLQGNKDITIQQISGIRQIEIKEFDHIDRCITCHINVENSGSDSLALPFSTHPDLILEKHDLAGFACTLCHNGNGRSLRRKETCDDNYLSDWKPVESYCATCHLVIFDSLTTYSLMLQLNNGRQTFRQSGCLGCHKLRGVGGPFGPDLSSQGTKILQGYDFKNVNGDKSIYNWHNEHFSNPAIVSPGSIMPNYHFNPGTIHSLITLTLGFTQPTLPLQYYDIGVIQEFKNRRASLDGKNTYTVFCAACHGQSGFGREYKNNVFGSTALANPDFQAVASIDMINFIIQEGRSNRYMPSWRGKHSGLYDNELVTLNKFIRGWRKVPPSYSRVNSSNYQSKEGKEQYRAHCATCHGENRSGGIGPSLNSNTFISLATDRFLYKILVNGRSNTAMPAWSRFSGFSIKSLIRYLQPKQRFSKDQHGRRLGNINRGNTIYHYQCGRCHGATGMGGIGPAILNRDFLDAASDYFLEETIKQGRSHTPMFGLIRSSPDLSDLIAFMRSSADSIHTFLEPGPVLGNPEFGKKLYKSYCVECHGNKGEGVEAPALNNQEFLNAATNGFLLATVTLGRNGTPMPEWGKASSEHRMLSPRERHHLIAYIRQWQTITIKREPLDPIYKLLSAD